MSPALVNARQRHSDPVGLFIYIRLIESVCSQFISPTNKSAGATSLLYGGMEPRFCFALIFVSKSGEALIFLVEDLRLLPLT